MAIDTAIMKTAKMQFDAGDREAAKNSIAVLMKTSKRPNVKFQAAKFILEHSLEVEKHTEPAEQSVRVVIEDHRAKP